MASKWTGLQSDPGKYGHANKPAPATKTTATTKAGG